MRLKTNRLALFAAAAAVCIVTGCDDADSVSARWSQWLGKDQTRKMAIMPDGYARETQAGNYLAGQFAQYRQDWKTANQYLDKVMALDPGNIELQQRAMVLAMQAGDSSRAITLARKVLAEDHKNLLALLFIGVDQINRQDYAGAVRTLQKMPENGVADFIRPILIAWAKSADKRVDLEALVAGGPLHAYHALLIADYLGKVNDPNLYFVNVLTGGIADKHILEMMADVFARQGDKALAEKIYATLLAQPEAEATTSSRIQLLEDKRNGDTAAQSASRIQTPAQGAAEAFYNLARILFQEQSEDSALVFTRLSEMLDPDKDDVKMLMATMMVKAGHPQDAIAIYKSVKPGAPGYPESQRSAAELLEQEGQVDQAISFLDNGYAKEKDPNYLIQIGDVYRRADRHADAIKAYDRAADALGGKISSDYWNLLYARGMSHERNGDFAQAEADLQAALEFKPDHPYLLNYLGYSWADQDKKLPDAKKLIEKAANLKPDDGYIIDSLGWVYYKLGDYQDAVKELEKAIELVPYDPTINDHLGDAYWRVGRKNEARFQWQRALNHAETEKQKADLAEKLDTGLKEPDPAVKQAKSAVAAPSAPAKR